MSVGNPVSLPQASARLVDGRGFPTREFYRFFQSLASITQTNASASAIAALQAQVAQLQQEIDNLPDGQYPVLQALFPLVSYGLLQNGFAQLVWKGTTDDVPEGSTNEYFTDERAYNALKSDLTAGSNITLTPDDSTQRVRIDASSGGYLPVMTGIGSGGEASILVLLDDGACVGVSPE